MSGSAGASSLNARPISRTSVGTRRHISGSVQPISWAWRMARRMIRRST